MEKRKLLLKDGTAIILEAGSCLGQMEAAYEGREALMTDWEKMTKENLSRVQIKNGDTVTGTYEHLILGDPVLVVRGKEDGTLIASWGRSMIQTLTRIYRETGNEQYLTNAVKKKWITEEEKAQIMAEVNG